MSNFKTSSSNNETNDSQWEKQMLEKLAFAAVNEQRRSRRWGIFFKLLLALYLATLLVLSFNPDMESLMKGEEDHTALVDVEGVIAAGQKASADNIITGLREAFEDEKTRGVILRINSPGGSPVQAGYVYDEIKRLRKEYPDIPLNAVIVDLCASGGYYIAAAADNIYASKTSIVGSIGVRMDGFGFVDTMNKIGVERRLLTAGEHKAFLDPFTPVDEEEVGHVKQLLNEVHEEFIRVVKEGRGDRLVDNKDLFTGLIWTGEQGKALGLIDEYGSSGYVAREVYDAEDIVDFTVKPMAFERLVRKLGASIGENFAAVLGINQQVSLK